MEFKAIFKNIFCLSHLSIVMKLPRGLQWYQKGTLVVIHSCCNIVAVFCTLQWNVFLSRSFKIICRFNLNLTHPWLPVSFFAVMTWRLNTICKNETCTQHYFWWSISATCSQTVDSHFHSACLQFLLRPMQKSNRIWYCCKNKLMGILKLKTIMIIRYLELLPDQIKFL